MKNINFIFNYLCACVCVSLRVTAETRGIRFPGVRVTGGCEPPTWMPGAQIRSFVRALLFSMISLYRRKTNFVCNRIKAKQGGKAIETENGGRFPEEKIIEGMKENNVWSTKFQSCFSLPRVRAPLFSGLFLTMLSWKNQPTMYS